MKAKHLSIPHDQLLLQEIYTTVKQELKISPWYFYTILFLKLLIYVSLCVFAYYGILNAKNEPAFLFYFIIFGLSTVLLAFNFSHDFSHDTIFKNKKINGICFTLIYTLVGAHAASWKHRHIHAHHHAPNVDEHDTDLEISNIIRLLPNSPHLWFHRFQHIYAPFAYMFYSLFWIFIKDFKVMYPKIALNDQTTFSQYVTFWLQKITYLCITILIPILYSNQSLATILLAFTLMHFIQSLFLLLTFLSTHHVENTYYPSIDAGGKIDMSWLMNQIKSSNDIYPHCYFTNFVLGGFNNHIAHHLFPNMHHIYYPKVNKILYSTLRDNKIEPNNTTYLGGMRSHLRLLKKMGKDAK
jgi:linoleoyl-CoA desaturase